MFQTSKGFTMIETIAATTILFLAFIIIIPSFILIQQERKALYDELKIINYLEYTLHQMDYHDDRSQDVFTKTVDGITITLTFIMENDLWKGCAQWETNQQSKKSFCLYKRNE